MLAFGVLFHAYSLTPKRKTSANGKERATGWGSVQAVCTGAPADTSWSQDFAFCVLPKGHGGNSMTAGCELKSPLSPALPAQGRAGTALDRQQDNIFCFNLQYIEVTKCSGLPQRHTAIPLH